jgi:hypothetical protein
MTGADWPPTAAQITAAIKARESLPHPYCTEHDQPLEWCAHDAPAELLVLVVVDVTGDDRTPGQVAADVRVALEHGPARCYRPGERVIYVEDLPDGTRISAPGERNGRA